MPIDPRLLTLTQWLSPAYPVGAFAWSHGLEAAIHDGWVRDAEGLRDWLSALILDGSGRSDAVLISLAYQCEDAAALEELNQTARAFAPSQERRLETERQGQAFARVTRDVWSLDLPDLMLPVALGRAARLAGLEPEAVAALYLQAFASNLASAAQRLMPLGHTEAQRVLAGLSADCAEVAASVQDATPDALWSNTLLSDVAAMRHEPLEPRLFQS